MKYSFIQISRKYLEDNLVRLNKYDNYLLCPTQFTILCQKYNVPNPYMDERWASNYYIKQYEDGLLLAFENPDPIDPSIYFWFLYKNDLRNITMVRFGDYYLPNDSEEEKILGFYACLEKTMAYLCEWN